MKLQKIGIITRDKVATTHLQGVVNAYGFILEQRKPDLFITYGGDGTLLHAERVHPGIPKLQIRGSATCKKCHDHALDHALDLLRQGRYHVRREPKLEVTVRHGREKDSFLALNDCIVRNASPAQAMRFSLKVDKKVLYEELIGDGLVVSTPFGSTAYYHSITKETFEQGLGVALNNVTLDESPPLLVAPKSSIVLTVLRGPVFVAADNLHSRFKLVPGDEVRVSQARKKAIILRLI